MNNLSLNMRRQLCRIYLCTCADNYEGFIFAHAQSIMYDAPGITVVVVAGVVVVVAAIFWIMKLYC